MIQVYATQIPSKALRSQFAGFTAILPEAYRKRIAGFLREADALRTIFGLLLLRRIIYDRTGTVPENMNIEPGEYGKPFLPDFSELHFNISHSGEWVVCAVSNMPVGIDVEEIKPVDMQVAETVFALGELDKFKSIRDAEKLDAFYDLWTLKESCMKAAGKGLYMEPAGFCLEWPGEKINLKKSGLNFFRCGFADGYKLAVCGEEESISPDVIFVSDTECRAW